MRRVTPTLVVCLAAATVTGVLLARPAATADPEQTPGSSSTTSAYGTADNARLTVADFAFGPVTVPVGSVVIVVNQDRVTHTVTSADALFDTGPVPSGTEVELTAPAEPGTYPFFCVIHPSMTGDLVVEG